MQVAEIEAKSSVTPSSLPSTRLARAAINLAKYIRRENFSAVIMSGKSSALSHALFIAAWKRLLPVKPMPPIFIFNDEGNILLHKNIPGDCHDRLSRAQRFIDSNLPLLNTYKQAKACYVDEFISTGEKYMVLRSVFRSLGFEAISFAFYAGGLTVEKNGYVAELDMSLVTLLHQHTRDAERSALFRPTLAAALRTIKTLTVG